MAQQRLQERAVKYVTVRRRDASGASCCSRLSPSFGGNVNSFVLAVRQPLSTFSCAPGPERAQAITTTNRGVVERERARECGGEGSKSSLLFVHMHVHGLSAAPFALSQSTALCARTSNQARRVVVPLLAYLLCTYSVLVKVEFSGVYILVDGSPRHTIKYNRCLFLPHLVGSVPFAPVVPMGRCPSSWLHVVCYSFLFFLSSDLPMSVCFQEWRCMAFICLPHTCNE